MEPRLPTEESFPQATGIYIVRTIIMIALIIGVVGIFSIGIFIGVALAGLF